MLLLLVVELVLFYNSLGLKPVVTQPSLKRATPSSAHFTSATGNRNAFPRSSMRLNQMGGLAEKLGGIVEFISGQAKITEANIESTLDEVRTILLDADVNLQVTNALITKVKEKAIGMKVESGQKPGEQFINLLAAELVEVMGQAQVPLTRRSDGRPNVILMCGLQGAGINTRSIV